MNEKPIQILASLEFAKLDKSGFGYEVVRNYLPYWLANNPAPWLLQFVEDEMQRDRPFYPDKIEGKAPSREDMERSMMTDVLVEFYRDTHPELDLEDALEKVHTYYQKSLPFFKRSRSTLYSDLTHRYKALNAQATANAKSILEEYA